MDNGHFKRITSVFSLSETFLLSKPRGFDFTSLYWKEENKNKLLTAKALVNFRARGGLSSGLDDNFNVWAADYEKIKSFIPEDYIIDRLPSVDVGNAGLTKFRSKYLDLNKLHHIYFLYLLQSSSALRDDSSTVICEIGGGYGSFAELLLGSHRKAILIDLPLSNALATHYLTNLYPNKKLFLFDDYLANGSQISLKDFEKYDIAILPPGCNYDENLKIDLIVNARSFMEMTSRTIKYHFRFIQQHLKEGGLFLNINRYQKVASGEVINFHNYPYDSRWEVLESIQLKSQPHIHFLLTRRTNKHDEGNIRQALRFSKIVGSRYRLGKMKLLLSLLRINLYKLRKYLLRK